MLTLTVSSDCLLLGIDAEVEQELKQLLTIDNPKYLSAKRYGRWIGKRLKPTLQYYEPVPGGLRFPRGFSNQAILVCREHMGRSPEIIDQRRRLPEADFIFSGSLRPYQREAVASGLKRSFGVIEAGTGSGKTIIALALVAARRQPVLVVVHSKELLYQWQERATEFLGCPVGLVGDGHFVVEPFTVAIVNSARRHVERLVPHFGHLIVDECHRVPATLFTDVVSHFDSHFLLGLSATAFRSDDGFTRLIYYFMGDSIHKVDQDELKLSGAILKPRLTRRETPFTFHYRGDYQALIRALTSHQGRNLQIIEDICAAVRDQAAGTALVVSDRVGHCEIFSEQLAARGLRVELLTGQVSQERRSAIVSAVQNAELQVLVATLQLISEGFDCPGLSSLFLTTPITFEGRLLQVIGRILRPAANKQARVFDYIDQEVPVLRRSALARGKVLAQL
jgi:superfamily II DNA or RNA helicase